MKENQHQHQEVQEDEWVKSAMDDTMLVVHLLLRLKHAEPEVLPTKLAWGVRQRRSRHVVRCKKEGTGGGELTTRASPTTPLSWSGSGGGGAATGDCYEESSRRLVRSKVTGAGETPHKRSRKKKTFAELKEAETFLLNERRQLKKELALLQTNYQKEMNVNKSLKRKELGLQFQSAKRTCASDAAKQMVFDQSCQADPAKQMVFDQSCQADRIPSILSTGRTCQELDVAAPPTHQPSYSHEPQENNVPCQSVFVLPDLNLPLDEDSAEDLYGMS